jgi:DNA-binding NarL/FixJ family response regulator
VIVYSTYASPALTLASQTAGADGVVDKSEPASALLTAIRSVAPGETHVPSIPPDAYAAAAARLAWRRQRIVGRLRPKLRSGPIEQSPTPRSARAPPSRSS